MKILAVDLGKVKSVACDYWSQTGEHEFETVRTEPAILEDLFRRRRPDRVVIEVGPAAGWITDLAARMKIELQVANPSHPGWRWRGVKTKTDRVRRSTTCPVDRCCLRGRRAGDEQPPSRKDESYFSFLV
ncbi:MAG: hypothetical protein IIB60_01210 [Planctomycetes bacterium]|nr:hypothetical protein [Planctomycetota bacterium]